jgi:hypothetical protein
VTYGIVPNVEPFDVVTVAIPQLVIQKAPLLDRLILMHSTVPTGWPRKRGSTPRFRPDGLASEAALDGSDRMASQARQHSMGSDRMASRARQHSMGSDRMASQARQHSMGSDRMASQARQHSTVPTGWPRKRGSTPRASFSSLASGFFRAPA